MTLSLMSMMSKTEMYLIFLTSLMMTDSYCTQSNSRLDHLLFRFSLQRMFTKWSFLAILENIKKIRKENLYIYQLYVYISYENTPGIYIYIYI